MSKHDDGGLAFPGTRVEYFSTHGVTNKVTHPGATWLDLAAMHAMQGLIAKPETRGAPDGFAKEAYDYAAALLSEKRKREEAQ